MPTWKRWRRARPWSPWVRAWAATPQIAALVHALAETFPQPMVLDADALVGQVSGLAAHTHRVITPHPGEMARLTGKTTAEVQADRVGARAIFATGHGVILVLKGQRTVIAFPDGRVWINPTGTPAMGTGGTGDILTGHDLRASWRSSPSSPDQAVAAAVYLHGLAGADRRARARREVPHRHRLLQYLPDAPWRTCADVSHRV